MHCVKTIIATHAVCIGTVHLLTFYARRMGTSVLRATVQARNGYGYM